VIGIFKKGTNLSMILLKVFNQHASLFTNGNNMFTP
jgi:hypothetical protein